MPPPSDNDKRYIWNEVRFWTEQHQQPG